MQPGDTLDAIAARFDTTTQELITLNPNIDPLSLSVDPRMRMPLALELALSLLGARTSLAAWTPASAIVMSGFPRLRARTMPTSTNALDEGS